MKNGIKKYENLSDREMKEMIDVTKRLGETFKLNTTDEKIIKKIREYRNKRLILERKDNEDPTPMIFYN